MVLKPLTAEDLVKELAFDRYISGKDLSDMTTKCQEVFASQIERTSDGVEHVQKALEFMTAIWRKYDCEDIADVYDKFVKMEEALFGLEREEESGRRYRDHFVHMFNCFVFGLRVISSLLCQCDGYTTKKLFKIEDESLRGVGVPFTDYPYDKRLFYLWMLISTFHDIAIPFQHLPELGRGIGEFVGKFGWAFTDPHISMPSFDSSQLWPYFDLLASIYGGKLETVNEGRKYRRSDESKYYLTKLLGREFNANNHGVLSGFFMWKTIEEIFLVDRSDKHSLGMGQFNKYAEYVLEQDIARAALAISLHALGKDRKTKALPKVLPIGFDEFPLTFLLVLSDELQEYLRWEGTSVRRQLTLHCHPQLETKHDVSDNGVCVTVSFSLEGANREALVAQAKRMAAHKDEKLADESISGVADLIGGQIKKSLEEKLKLGQNFKVKLNIYEDWDQDKTRYSKDLCSPAQ